MPRLAASALLALLSLTAFAERPADRPREVEARRAAAAKKAGAEFLRVLRDDDGEPISLDTSIVEYRETAAAAAQAGRKTPLQVDLVAAVHVGGADYYEILDRMFTDYDAVLYELVAPPNARVPMPGR